MFKIFLSKKEKIANKLYNSLFVKEYILENIKIKDNIIDALIISNIGIFVFKILDYEENNLEKIAEFKKELGNNSDFISSILEYKYNVVPFLVGDKLNKNNKEVISIFEFRDYINKLNKVISNEDVENIRRIILSLNNRNDLAN